MTSETTLRVALVSGDRFTPLYDRLREFTNETGIRVEVTEKLPAEGLYARLKGGTVEHDLVSLHDRYVPALATRLLPLDELLSPEEISTFDQEALAGCRYEERLLALPRSVETRLLFYRTDIFDDRREQQWFAEASEGRELRVPTTWVDLAAVAQYFTRAGKMYGFAFAGQGPDLLALFLEILASAGGTGFDADGTPRFYSRAGEWALTLLRDLCLRWEAAPPETAEYTPEDVSEAFRMGRCAMVVDTPDTARLLGDPSFSAVAGWHSVASVPSGEGGKAVWSGCPAFAIPASTRQREAALELLRFLTSAESQLREAKHGALPTRLDARDQARERARPGTLGHLRFSLAEQTLRSAPLRPPHIPAWGEMEAAIWPCLHAALTDEKEPAEALRLAAEASEAACAEHASDM